MILPTIVVEKGGGVLSRKKDQAACVAEETEGRIARLTERRVGRRRDRNIEVQLKKEKESWTRKEDVITVKKTY